jgi:hypothetical protein
VDLDFGLGGLVVAAIALGFSVFAFYISRTKAPKSEQIKTSRYFWERINEKYDPIVEVNRSQDKSRFTDDRWKMLRPLAREIDYFAFLIIKGEITDETTLSYYELNLSGYIEAIMKHYATADVRSDLRDQYPNFNKLIKKWNIKVPKDENTS